MTPNELQKRLDQVTALAKTEAEAIGFLPRAAYQDAHEGGRMRLVHDGDDVLSFAVVGAIHPHRRIFQACTREDARREHIATNALAFLIGQDHRQGVLSHVAHVAEDLDAVLFWQRLGFGTIGELNRQNTRGRRILVMVKPTPAADSLRIWCEAQPQYHERRKLAAAAGMADAYDAHLYRTWLTNQ